MNWAGACWTLLGLAAAFGAGWVVVQEEKRWQAWALEHECKVVQRIAPTVSSSVGFDQKGNVITTTTTTPERVGWLCDDGVIHWR